MTIKVEIYDPSREQFNAQVQGIYESLVKSHVGVKYSTPFKTRNVRLDRKHKLSQSDINDLLSKAFAIATKVGQKLYLLEEGSQDPTLLGKAKAAKRVGYTVDQIYTALRTEGIGRDATELIINDLPRISKTYNWNNILDYEMTLAMRRKSAWNRILVMKKGRKKVYVLMPEGIEYNTEQEALAAAQSNTKKLKRNPAQMKVSTQNKKPVKLIVCYETRRCNLSLRDLKKVRSLKDLYSKTQELIGKTELFDEARAHNNAAVGRNMCKYCIIFAFMADKSLALVDYETGGLKNIEHFKKELGSNDPRGSL